MGPYRRKFGGQANNILPKWNDAQTVKFFQLYEGHRCLWDGKDKEYRNPDSRAAAYQDIILEMNLNCDEMLLRKKIKNIRTIYARELKEVKRTRKAGCPDPVYIPTLSWYNDADRFLRNIVSERTVALPRKRSNAGGGDRSNNVEHEEETYMEEDYEENEEDYLPASLLEDEMTEEAQENEEMRSIRSGHNQSNQSQSHSHTPSYRSPIRRTVSKLQSRKLNKYNRQSTVSTAEKAISRLANMAQAASSSAAAVSMTDEDEFTTFGRLVTSQLRSMPFQKAIMCQSKILTLLTEERIHWLNEDACREDQENIATTIVHMDPDGEEFIEVKGCE